MQPEKSYWRGTEWGNLFKKTLLRLLRQLGLGEIVHVDEDMKIATSFVT